jgi:hypothetical protein
MSRILTLDPSSTAIGWAHFLDGNLEACGVSRPRGARLWTRIDAAILIAERLVHDARFKDGIDLSDVVIEVTSGRRYGKHHQAAIVGLALAQGAVYATAEVKLFDTPTQVNKVDEQQWTGGKPKTARAGFIAQVQPLYRAYQRHDNGMDAADAIGLGLWWLGKQHQKQLLERAK